ncbi:metal-sensing transcriptional repressor [Listeria rustica]|uniref:Metal-sensitive transcriptional regulator n=1 Tax=Listeria rustica TaxID=2713503 RepID=A0A7W1T8I3_9LIST|nr:metal-sensing transcriptional repressor [Listeria rustica]MBA3927398.1 metal-sensitive transcriptional regulator [Listeria rustica]
MSEVRKSISNRFAKIEGHVKSIKKMTDEERSYEDIMLQVAAVKKALQSAEKVIFSEQMKEMVESGVYDQKRVDSFIK